MTQPENTARESMNGLESGLDSVAPLNVDEDKAADSAQTPADPNVIDWDGPNDPANPINWSKSVRIGHMILISVITLIAYVFRCFWSQP